MTNYALFGQSIASQAAKLVGVLALVAAVAGCDRPREGVTIDLAAPDRAGLADSVQQALEQHIFDAWYPRAVDTVHGGFLSNFTYDWQAEDSQEKFIVTQARHVWTLARAAEFSPERRDEYLGYGEQGVDFLRDHMWDPEEGGFRALVDRDGAPRQGGSGFTQGKTAYGNAFGIYGLAAYADVSGDTAALGFAQEAFRWMDEHMHDPENGGYFQFLGDDGEPLRVGVGGRPAKDQNSSIHVLEALTELYRVWPDRVLEERLNEMLTIVRDTIVGDPPYLRLFFQADWTPISFADSSRQVIEDNIGLDHVSFGHDVETAFLMLEASDALGLDRRPTLDVGRRMVEHALAHGWDDDVGGIVDGSYYFDPDEPPVVVLEGKAWWAQFEMLNTMLMMSRLFPDNEHAYYARFADMWAYIDAFLVDHEHGGVYSNGLDVEPEAERASKGNIWKAGYHDGRALMHVTERLRAGPGH